jgi:hypothetical protein
MIKLRSWILMGACLASAACGGDDPPATTEPDGGMAPASEECAPGTPEFKYGADGLTAADSGGTVSVRIMDSNYATPAKDFNDWTIQILDGSGAPMPQARLLWSCAWMPLHMHGSNPKSVKKLDGGEYELLQQNLGMYGGWKVRLWVDPAGQGMEYTPSATTGSLSGDACAPTNPSAVGKTSNVEFSICVPRQRGS